MGDLEESVRAGCSQESNRSLKNKLVEGEGGNSSRFLKNQGGPEGGAAGGTQGKCLLGELEGKVGKSDLDMGGVQNEGPVQQVAEPVQPPRQAPQLPAGGVAGGQFGQMPMPMPMNSYFPFFPMMGPYSEPSSFPQKQNVMYNPYGYMNHHYSQANKPQNGQLQQQYPFSYPYFMCPQQPFQPQEPQHQTQVQVQAQNQSSEPVKLSAPNHQQKDPLPPSKLIQSVISQKTQYSQQPHSNHPPITEPQPHSNPKLSPDLSPPKTLKKSPQITKKKQKSPPPRSFQKTKPHFLPQRPAKPSPYSAPPHTLPSPHQLSYLRSETTKVVRNQKPPGRSVDKVILELRGEFVLEEDSVMYADCLREVEQIRKRVGKLNPSSRWRKCEEVMKQTSQIVHRLWRRYGKGSGGEKGGERSASA